MSLFKALFFFACYRGLFTESLHPQINNTKSSVRSVNVSDAEPNPGYNSTGNRTEYIEKPKRNLSSSEDHNSSATNPVVFSTDSGCKEANENKSEHLRPTEVKHSSLDAHDSRILIFSISKTRYLHRDKRTWFVISVQWTWNSRQPTLHFSPKNLARVWKNGLKSYLTLLSTAANSTNALGNTCKSIFQFLKQQWIVRMNFCRLLAYIRHWSETRAKKILSGSRIWPSWSYGLFSCYVFHVLLSRE